MINNYEYQIFYEELKRLNKEYQRCEDATIKKFISMDIRLIENALEAI
ncbi:MULTISPECIES: hypothetical protein [Mesobacillus]|uniref:Uncharacterized protein n=1 Tax=Mesobacillus selenatarsenatis TaxID=388741 RepID=A0A846TQJ8_9BACI|nr:MULTISPECIES: hypothetical protein [Mesobacillus]NKE06475.1 hypothetical protein [Mesobacillus selenatarsenatis]